MSTKLDKLYLQALPASWICPWTNLCRQTNTWAMDSSEASVKPLTTNSSNFLLLRPERHNWINRASRENSHLTVTKHHLDTRWLTHSRTHQFHLFHLDLTYWTTRFKIHDLKECKLVELIMKISIWSMIWSLTKKFIPRPELLSRHRLKNRKKILTLLLVAMTTFNKSLAPHLLMLVIWLKI